MIDVTIICLIYRSTKYLQFVYDQVHKYTDMTKHKLIFITNDATQEVLDYLVDHNMDHYIFNNTLENIEAHGTTEYYVNNVYRAYNYGAQIADTNCILFINSDMAFSPYWLENMVDKMESGMCITSRLVESGRYPSGEYAISMPFGMSTDTYEEDKFIEYCKTIEEDSLTEGGLYMPLLIYKKDFMKVGMYPEGNITPDSSIFEPVIAKIYTDCITGDKVLMMKLKEFGIVHYTSFNSTVYHFQNGEKME